MGKKFSFSKKSFTYTIIPWHYIYYLIWRLGTKSGISKLNPFAFNMWVIYEKGKPVNSLNKQIDKTLVSIYIYKTNQNHKEPSTLLAMNLSNGY